MKYVIVLFLTVMACIFILIPQTSMQSDKIAITATSALDKTDIQIGVRETVKYFEKFNQELRDEVKIIADTDKLALRFTLIDKYKISESEAELIVSGRGFYMGNTIIINTQMANSSIVKIGTIAHELTHHYQKQIIHSTSSLVWLQEGMADVTAGNILEESHQGTAQVLSVSQLNLSSDLDLANLHTDEDWMHAVKNYGGAAVYTFSSIAVRELVSRTGYWSLIEFHNELNQTKNVEKSFKKAFLIELRDFEKEFSEDIKNGNQYYYKYY